MNPLLNLLSAFTGAVVATFASLAPSGWLLLNGDTIGKTGSGATYAGSAYKNLYLFLWANVAQDYAAVSGGRGASAQADWDANKTLKLPDARGRTVICAGTGTAVEHVVGVTVSGNAITVPSNTAKWVTGMQVSVVATGFTGIPDGTYWIIRNSATSVKFANSLANAQNGTAIAISGTGSVTMTHTYTARTLGEGGGEEAHAMSASELLAHTHPNPIQPNSTGSIRTDGANAGYVGHNGSIGNTGGNAAMNVMQPFLALNYVIKT